MEKAQDRLDEYEDRLETFCMQEESAERNAYE